MIGRKREIAELNRLYNSGESELIAIYGRRRVGKTFLINHFFYKRFDFKLTGDFKADRKVQLDNFHS